MNYRARRATSIVFGLMSAVGTVLTAILAIKETPKALEKIKELKKNKNSRKRDYIKALIPIYWPAATMCLGTIASTTVSNVISMRTEASLIATSTMLSQGWRKYKGKVQDIFGIDADKLIRNEVSGDEYKDAKIDKSSIESDEKLYWEEHLGFFKCKELDFMAALVDLNQRLHTPDPDPDGTCYFTTLAVLMNDAGAKVYDQKKFEACMNMGWTTDYLCEVYSLKCIWVHAEYTSVVDKETGEVLYTRVKFIEEPIVLQESEVNRLHYKSREEFEHNAEMDLHDSYAIDLHSDEYVDPYDESDENCGSLHDEIEAALVNYKPDCDGWDDDGMRFMPSNPKLCSNMKYSTGEDFDDPNNEKLMQKDLPNVEDIPKD